MAADSGKVEEKMKEREREKDRGKKERIGYNKSFLKI